MTTYRSSERARPVIQLTAGQELAVKDHRGFTVFTVNEAGDVKQKGRSGKL